MTIRYVHAGDLTTNQVHALTWNVGLIGDRYQEIAIEGTRVVGSWTYGIESKRRGRICIDSSYTDVMPSFRRKGVARQLWFAGIARWTPTWIESRIGTDEGRSFLAAMLPRIVYAFPETHLSVKTRTEDEACWEDRCNWEAQSYLRTLGEQRRDAKPLVEVPKVKLLKAVSHG